MNITYSSTIDHHHNFLPQYELNPKKDETNKKKSKRVARFIYNSHQEMVNSAFININHKNMDYYSKNNYKKEENISSDSSNELITGICQRKVEKVPVFFNIIRRGTFPSIIYENGNIYVD